MIGVCAKGNKLIPAQSLNLKEGTYKLDKGLQEDAMGGGASYPLFCFVYLFTTTFATRYIGVVAVFMLLTLIYPLATQVSQQ